MKGPIRLHIPEAACDPNSGTRPLKRAIQRKPWPDTRVVRKIRLRSKSWRASSKFVHSMSALLHLSWSSSGLEVRRHRLNFCRPAKEVQGKRFCIPAEVQVIRALIQLKPAKMFVGLANLIGRLAKADQGSTWFRPQRGAGNRPEGLFLTLLAVSLPLPFSFGKRNSNGFTRKFWSAAALLPHSRTNNGSI